MPEEHIAPDAWRRERWIVLTTAIVLVLARSAIFVVRPTSYFDSDQAVFGLMAKHLAELRAFPLFMYGQSYILGVEAWMAAPLFALFRPSAALLKLPLLVINAAVAWLLLRTFEREMGLRPLAAAAASLPFLLPAVALSAVYVEPSGGNVEPYLYVLLVWVLRDRPVACGAILAIGFLQREFTLYSLVALLCLDLGSDLHFLSPVRIENGDPTPGTSPGAPARAGRWRRRGQLLGTAALVWTAIQGLRPWSSGSGPGTSIDHLYGASNNILELAGRTCISPGTAVTGVARLLSTHWPELLGTAPYPLSSFAIESSGLQGLAWSSWLPALFVVLSIAGVVARSLSTSRIPIPRFAAYLTLVGLFSAMGYVLGRCGQVTFYGMRYELLSVLGIVGLGGWFLATRPAPRLTAAWGLTLAAWLVVIVVPHGRLLNEYATHPPVPAKIQLIDALSARGVRYGRADYWIAYYVSFLTRERIILASPEVDRIHIYSAIVAAHASESIRLSRRPCENGTTLIPGVYQCP